MELLDWVLTAGVEVAAKAYPRAAKAFPFLSVVRWLFALMKKFMTAGAFPLVLLLRVLLWGVHLLAET